MRGFVAVAEEGSFGKAAIRLRMTQPPLSRQIQRLERAVGFEVFVRTSRSVALTPAGRIFLEEARRVLHLADTAPLLARRVARGTAGQIRIGFTAVAALNVFGDWIRRIHRQLPDIDVVLTEMMTSAQVEALLASEIDVGIMRGVPRSNVLDARLIHAEALVVAVPDGHPLTAFGRPPTLTEIADHDVVTYGPAPARYFHELVISTFHNAGAAPNYVQYVSQVHSLLVLVDAGIGIALVPRSAARLGPPNVRFLEVAGMPEDHVELHCSWRAHSDNPTLSAVLAVLDEVTG
ncbi:LysR family transcriptional regulator [Nonomuraea sp. M3C6]|uniref:LysR family transcriptional regulator n=1 Tax=Nonomuraea marmarensis TaxID=3351344 RepID=A0ABW7AHY5_9ACTN